eukprot:3832431-Prymnesium_polylepis.1
MPCGAAPGGLPLTLASPVPRRRARHGVPSLAHPQLPPPARPSRARGTCWPPCHQRVVVPRTRSTRGAGASPAAPPAASPSRPPHRDGGTRAAVRT